MSDVSAWNPLDSDNTAPPPDGWPEFMQPSMVNNTGRMMMGAVKRMYDQQVSGAIVLPYLKLAGGQTVSGAVTFSAGLTATAITSTGTINATSTISTGGTLSAAGNVSGGSYNMAGTALATVTGTNTLLYDRANQWVLALDAAGTSYANASHVFKNRGATTNWATIDGTGLAMSVGNISTPGNLGGSTLTTGGAATIGNGLTVSNGNVTATAGSFFSRSLNFGESGGRFVAVGADIMAGGNIYAVNEVGFGIVHDGNNDRFFKFRGDYFWFQHQPSTNNTWYQGDSSGVFWLWRYSDRACLNLKGPVGGLGDYQNLSDRRFKSAETIIPATAGLAEIVQLQPVEFERLPVEGSPAPKREIGFIAQDVAAVLPQAVGIMGVELPDGSGGLDSSEPTLGVTSGAIVAALVNALKTIDARLTALEGR